MASIPELTRYRWTLPILAQLARTGGSRFVPLAAGLGLSRDALRQTLDELIERGLIRPNPGYGHPSRPEYVLTQEGHHVAPVCARLVDHVRRNGLDGVAFKKWSLPIVAALTRPQRYGDLRRSVGATPRALALALKDLIAADIVERRVHDGFPPGTSYKLTIAGRVLRKHVTRLDEALKELTANETTVRRRRA